MNKDDKRQSRKWRNIFDAAYIIPFILAIFLETSTFFLRSDEKDYLIVHLISVLFLVFGFWMFNILQNRKKNKKSALEENELRIEIAKQNLEIRYRIEDELKRYRKLNDELQERLKKSEFETRQIEKELFYISEAKNVRITQLEERLRFSQIERSPNQFIDTKNVLGVQSLYLDYKTLSIRHFKEILQSLENLYLFIYGVSINKSIQKNELNRTIKTNPIDILRIESIQTGNSIIIKTKTGWLPSLEAVDGNFELALPKGAVALIFVGYLLQNTISFGITNYKEILEIKKLQMENRTLKKQLNELQGYCLNLTNDEQVLLQKEVLNFYNLTIEHHHINTVLINNDNKVSK